jgi:hypothetical protein
VKGVYSRKLSDEQIDEVASRYRKGENILELSYHFEVSQACIRNALILRRVERRKSGRGLARLKTHIQRVRV